MKRPDFQKLVFQLNVGITALVFFLLSPTVHVYQSWFPDKRNSLWMIPVITLGLSLSLWLFASLTLPWMIEQGWVKDLRQNSREGEPVIRLSKILGPMLISLFHLSLLIFFSASVISFLSREPFEKLFVNFP